jgi:hypothetical protein
MNYIHQNPIRARLSRKPVDWEYSSYRDYAGIRNGILTNKSLMAHYFDSSEKFVRYSEDIVEFVKKEYWV